MNRKILSCLVVSALACAAVRAQSFGYVFTTSQTESTLSGSGGTVLQTLRPNEVASVEFTPCPVISAEKWAPVTCYNTMAGDDDNNGFYYNPTMFGSIDALCDIISPVACSNQRTVYYSPSVALGTNVSAPLQLRPGDTGRIIHTGTLDGKIQYFLRAEEVQIALGMPSSPIVVDVDAIAADPGYGVFFSLNATHTVNTTCGVTQVLDGDLLAIPTWAITWTSDFRVASVLPGSAQVVYTEAQMDTMVQNAGIVDRFGVCITQIQDLEALDIDWGGPVSTFVTCPGTIMSVPTLVFSGSLMTGCGLCTTQGGGQIHFAGCGPLASSCGTPLPTLGNQMGLLPPNAALGVPSYVNALTSTFINRYVIEPQVHSLTAPTTVSIDTYSPGPLNWVFVALAPPVVAPSVTIPTCFFPEAYPVNWVWFANPPQGFASFTTPQINIPVKLVWQGITFLTSGIELSTPASIDIQ
jgi:hypothetical protein